MRCPMRCARGRGRGAGTDPGRGGVIQGGGDLQGQEGGGACSGGAKQEGRMERGGRVGSQEQRERHR